MKQENASYELPCFLLLLEPSCDSYLDSVESASIASSNSTLLLYVVVTTRCQGAMEGFAEYSSDSDGENKEKEEGQDFQPPPAWQQDDEADDQEESREERENKDRGERGDASETSKGREEAESAQKKRRLLPNPLDALSNATTSFLAAREEQQKEEEQEEGNVAEPARLLSSAVITLS